MLEDRAELVLRDADPGILHREADQSRLAGRRLDADRHGAFGRELERIVHEIGEHLSEPDRIRPDHRLGRQGDLRREIEALAIRPVREQPQDAFDRLADVEIERFDLQLAGLDLGQVEDVVDDGEQAFAGPCDHLRLAARVARQVSLRQEFRHDQDAVHRRADFVAHGRQEVGLGAVRGGGFGSCLGVIACPVRDIALQAFAMLGEALVAVADVRQHAVEAVDQHANLVVLLLRQDQTVIMVAPDLAHGGREREQRGRDRRLHADRQHQAREQRHRGADDREAPRVEDAPEEVARVDDQAEGADRLALEDDRDARLDGAAGNELAHGQGG